jgi:hypothetical protein
LLEILTFGGLGEQDDCSLTTESAAFGGKFAQNLSSQPPKACFNQNFSKFRPDQEFLKHNEMKPLGIDMW